MHVHNNHHYLEELADPVLTMTLKCAVFMTALLAAMLHTVSSRCIETDEKLNCSDGLAPPGRNDTYHKHDANERELYGDNIPDVEEKYVAVAELHSVWLHVSHILIQNQLAKYGVLSGSEDLQTRRRHL